MKYPIGLQSFEDIRKSKFLYIDKTDMVYNLTRDGKYYFLSRPRRFGKSLLVSTLEAYFSGKKELFAGLAIDSLEKEWASYPVLHLDLNSQKYDDTQKLEAILDWNISRWEELYGSYEQETTLSLRFSGVIERAYKKTGKQVVILVDEYDKPLLQAIGNNELQSDYRGLLKSVYGALKSQDRYIRFALLTGVTKFGKVSVFSDLNNLQDLSMDEEYQALCGVTQDELETIFAEPIKQLATKYKLSVEEALYRLKERYDGYHFVENGIGIYNPFSLLNTFKRLQFGSYWFETGTPTYLVELLKQDNYRLPNLTKEVSTADVLNCIDTASNNPIPVLYQSGYLTIKSFDEEFGEYRLGFPNKEVEEGFTRFLLPYYTGLRNPETPFSMGEFVRDLRSGRPEDFMQRMATLFADTDYKIVGNSELYFQNAFYLIAKMMGFYTKVERTTSNGRMDLTIETNDYVYIVEFKLDGSADVALQQIDEKGYAQPFAMDKRQLFKIGVNFSLEKRCIDKWLIA